MLTIESLTEEMKPLHNHICVLYDMELVRLIGVAESDQDYYYVVRSIDSEQRTGALNGEFYASAVGHIVSLKDVYPNERYEHMDQIFDWNGAPPSEEFFVRKIEE